MVWNKLNKYYFKNNNTTIIFTTYKNISIAFLITMLRWEKSQFINE